MPQNNSIEFHLTGSDLAPGLVRSKDIGQLIAAVEEMIVAKVIADHPDKKREQVVVGLSNVLPGSITLQFASSDADITTPALKEIARSLATNDFHSLPKDSVNSLQEIVKFSKAQKCIAEIYELNGTRQLLAAITPETEIVDCEPVRGETTIYGVVTRVGGANEKTPTIQLRTLEGKLIYCKANRKNAKIAAQRLYKQIGLLGVAEWDVRTYEILSFEVHSVALYERTPLPNAIESISQAYGEQFDEIVDVDSFVRELRNGV